MCRSWPRPLRLTGCGDGASAPTTPKPHATPTYTIAYEGPLSGGVAQLGLNMKFAVALAINQANAGKTFGELPFKLKFVAKDDQGSGTVSPTIADTARRQLERTRPSSARRSRERRAAAEPTFSSSAHMSTVSPSATHTTLAQSGWKNFFRVVADDSIQGPTDANYRSRS